MPTIGTVLAKRQPLYNLPAGATVLDAAKMMVEHNIGALPILDGDRLVGVFSERDLLRRVIAEGRDPARIKVTEVMSTDLVTADIKDDDATCLKKMTECGCRHLPVVEGDRLVAFKAKSSRTRPSLLSHEDPVLAFLSASRGKRRSASFDGASSK